MSGEQPRLGDDDDDTNGKYSIIYLFTNLTHSPIFTSGATTSTAAKVQSQGNTEDANGSTVPHTADGPKIVILSPEKALDTSVPLNAPTPPDASASSMPTTTPESSTLHAVVPPDTDSAPPPDSAVEPLASASVRQILSV